MSDYDIAGDYEIGRRAAAPKTISGRVVVRNSRGHKFPGRVLLNHNALTAVVDMYGAKRHFSVNLAPLRANIIKTLSNRVGWGFSDITRVASKVVNKVASKKLYSQIQSAINDPRLAKGIAVASIAFPALGVTYASVRAASAIVNAATEGNKDAISKIKNVAELAAQGHPAAVKAKEVLKKVYEAKAVVTAEKVTNTVASAAKLVKEVRNGNRSAQVKLMSIAAKAKAGNPAAKQAAHVLSRVYRVAKRTPPARVVRYHGKQSVLKSAYLRGLGF